MTFSITRPLLFLFISTFLFISKVYSQQTGPYCLGANQCENPQCETGYELVTFLSGVCGGIDYCCFPEGEMNNLCGIRVEIKAGFKDSLASAATDVDRQLSLDFNSGPNDEFPKEMRVPLGRPFYIRYAATGRTQTANCEVAETRAVTYQILENTDINPALSEDQIAKGLFTNQVILPLDNNEHTKLFVPVHLGNTKIRVIPTDTTITHLIY